MNVTQAQIDAVCGEAKAQGLRTLVHAHSADRSSPRSRPAARKIEHGLFADDAAIKAMADANVYFDPNIGLVLQNYLEHHDEYDGSGNFNEDSFAAMQAAIPGGVEVFKKALAAGIKMPMGTDAVAGAHGHNAREIIARVQKGGQEPMDAIIGATSLSAESMNLGKRHRHAQGGLRGRHHRRHRRSGEGHHEAARRDVRHARRQGHADVIEPAISRMRRDSSSRCASRGRDDRSAPLVRRRRRPGMDRLCGRRGRQPLLAAGGHRPRATSRGCAARGSGSRPRSAKPDVGTRPGMFENTPLMIDNVLYLSTPYNRVVALECGDRRANAGPTIRRPTTTDSRPTAPASCIAASPPGATARALRIFMNSRTKLICLDAKTGEPIDSFGDHGIVDLTKGLRWDVDPKRYTNTSPPVVYKDLVILGNGVGDRLTYKNDPPGDVRAFNARTGKQVWVFHTTPVAGDPETKTWGNDSWKVTGHTNVWGPFSLDADARPRLSAGDDAEQRLLRRASAGRQPVRRVDRLRRRGDRRAQVALPGRASRAVGLRSARGAGARAR